MLVHTPSQGTPNIVFVGITVAVELAFSYLLDELVISGIILVPDSNKLTIMVRVHERICAHMDVDTAAIVSAEVVRDWAKMLFYLVEEDTPSLTQIAWTTGHSHNLVVMVVLVVSDRAIMLEVEEWSLLRFNLRD